MALPEKEERKRERERERVTVTCYAFCTPPLTNYIIIMSVQANYSSRQLFRSYVCTQTSVYDRSNLLPEVWAWPINLMKLHTHTHTVQANVRIEGSASHMTVETFYSVYESIRKSMLRILHCYIFRSHDKQGIRNMLRWS